MKEQNLNIILDSLPQSVLVLGAGGRKIEFANAAAEDNFQTSALTLMRNGFDNLLSADSEVFALIDQVFSTNAPVNASEVDISGPKIGSGVIMDIYGAPLEGCEQKAILVLRERSIAQRLANRLSYRTAAKSVTGLAAMLAHEVKNPLSGIRGAAQLLERVVDGDDRELATLIRTETDRVVNIIERMEIFSDETPLAIQPVNMHSVLDQVRRIAENGFAKHVRFVEHYDPSLPPVSGSRDTLVQIFINLVKNSAEALVDTKHPRIELSSAYRPGIRVPVPERDSQMVLPLEFKVFDNGCGIREEIRADIFEPFVTTRINGSGLGLAFVAKTVGRHGGVVECDDSGNGTTFRLLFPAWTPVQHESGELHGG